MAVLRRKAPSIILDPQQHVILLIRELHVDVHGAGMFGDVAQRLLRDPEETFG
jgi:hypothetical protein